MPSKHSPTELHLSQRDLPWNHTNLGHSESDCCLSLSLNHSLSSPQESRFPIRCHKTLPSPRVLRGKKGREKARLNFLGPSGGKKERALLFLNRDKSLI